MRGRPARAHRKRAPHREPRRRLLDASAQRFVPDQAPGVMTTKSTEGLRTLKSAARSRGAFAHRASEVTLDGGGFARSASLAEKYASPITDMPSGFAVC